MRRAIELAKQAETFDEVPIGAVIVLNGEIVAEG
ncbi:MAG: tRNA-specific adenosine deaminase, partial [Clostridiales bacterium]|nr:tRNA-specific adenosine deaminase [Clostridiales bacterium]